MNVAPLILAVVLPLAPGEVREIAPHDGTLDREPQTQTAPDQTQKLHGHAHGWTIPLSLWPQGVQLYHGQNRPQKPDLWTPRPVPRKP